MLFDPDEVHRINRARLAIRLQVPPAVIDELPMKDFADLMEVLRAEAAEQNIEAERRRGKQGR